MQHPPTNRDVSSSIKERFTAFGSLCVVSAFVLSVANFGQTGAFYNNETLSPANAFAAGVWSAGDSPGGAPQVEVSASDGFSLVDPPDEPQSDAPTVPGDDASSTPPVTIGPPTTTLDTGTTTDSSTTP